MAENSSKAHRFGLMILSVFLTAVSCGRTYDLGVAEADAMVAEAIGINVLSERAATRDIGLGTHIQNTAFGRTIRDAVLSYPALTGQRSQIDKAKAGKDILLGSLRPQFSYGLTAGQNLLGSETGQAADVYVTVRQLIFDGAATRKRITEARINERQLNYELDALLSLLSRQMTQSALNLWRQREHLALAAEDVAAHEEFVERTARRVEGGVIAESDLLPAQSRLADARALFARAQSGLAQAEAAYASLIGPVPKTLPKPPLPPAIAADVARQRIATSSQMVIARLDVAEAQARSDLVKSGRYPGVFLETTGTRSDAFGDDADNEIFAGFSVDQTVFTGGQQRARERETASELEAAKSGLEVAERQLRQSLEVMLANRNAAGLEVGAAERAAQLNEANLAAVIDQFEVGHRTTADVLDAHRDLITAKNRLLTVTANRIEAELAILELTGDLASVFGIEFDPHSDAPRDSRSRAVQVSNPIISQTVSSADEQ